MVNEKDVWKIHTEAKEKSIVAVREFLEKWKKETGGNKYDEPMYCGFAWFNDWDVKASTRLGKALKEVGFGKGYPKGLRLSNPGNHQGQSMDAKEEGASAYARVLRSYGFNATMGSRAD